VTRVCQMFFLFFFLFIANAKVEEEERDFYYVIPHQQSELTLDLRNVSSYNAKTEYEWSLLDWPGRKYAAVAPKPFSSMPRKAYFKLKTRTLGEGFYRLSVDYDSKKQNLCEVYIQVTSDRMGELLSSSDRSFMNRLHWPLKKFFGWLNGRIPVLQAFAIYYHCFQDWTVADSVYLSIFYQKTWSESFHLNVSHYKDTNILRRRVALFTRHSTASACNPFESYCSAERKTFDERLVDYFQWNGDNPYLGVVKTVFAVFYWMSYPFVFLAKWTNSRLLPVF